MPLLNTSIFTSSSFFVIIIALLFIGFFIFYLTRVRNSRKREKIFYETKLSEIEAKAFTSQMSPHFIYNSLSTVQHLIISDEKQKAFDYISEFSLLMRQTLNNSRNVFISIEDEVSFLKRYVELEKFRFGNSFDYEYKIDRALNTGSYFIQPMLIQPIIENAIKHGLASKNEKGLLKVFFLLKDNLLECIIDDNGVGWQEASANSISVEHESRALNMIKERLNALKVHTNNTGRLEIIDKLSEGYEKGGTIVKLYIPLIDTEL